jgi:hypothetical protein
VLTEQGDLVDPLAQFGDADRPAAVAGTSSL